QILMKRFLLLVLAIVMLSSFTLFNVVLTKIYKLKNRSSEYALETVTDPSFSSLLSNNSDEISSLGNYYSNVKKETSIVQTYSEVLDNLQKEALSQKRYMDSIGIGINHLRMDKEDVNSQSIQKQNEILQSAEETKQKYAFNQNSIKQVNFLTSATKPDLSPSSKAEVEIFQEYFDLGKNIKYTPLEVFEDATGFNDPKLYAANKFARIEVRGLGRLSALQKLKDLNEKSSIEDISAYPNPFVDKVNFNLFLSEKSNIELVIYDLNGKKIDSHKQDNVIGNVKFVWDGTSANGTQVSNGVYVYRLISNSQVKLGKIILAKD
ncbi:MAG: T9SS type A sorting domain-containing protein, partial [Flammeovirgaceae bacterium]